MFRWMTTLALLVSTAGICRGDLIFTVAVGGTSGVDRIVRTDDNGLGQQNLWTGTGSTPRSLVVDPTTARVFWTDFVGTTPVIRSASAVDGTAFQSLTRANGAINSITMDIPNNDLYVFELPAGTRHFTKLEPDGSGVSTLLIEPTLNANTQLHVDGRFLYFTDSVASPRIARINLDDPLAGASTVVALTGAAGGLQGLTVIGGDVYWADNNDDTIKRRSILNPLDPVVTIASLGSSTPRGLTTDGTNLYYAEALASATIGGVTAGTGIGRIDLSAYTGTPLAPSRVLALATGEVPFGIAYFAIPEPSAMTLAVLGLAAFGPPMRSRRKAAHA